MTVIALRALLFYLIFATAKCITSNFEYPHLASEIHTFIHAFASHIHTA